MKNEKILTLIAEIDKCLEQLGILYLYFKQAEEDLKLLPEDKKYDLVIQANLLADYYTCLETAFVRISKFFENNLEKSKWHLNLLEKMTLDISGIRKRLLRDETYTMLKEILRFRHFKRYYFEFDYDRDRMDFLKKKYIQSYNLVKDDLNNYKYFLQQLYKQMDEN
jgi:hypothetical protein